MPGMLGPDKTASRITFYMPPRPFGSGYGEGMTRPQALILSRWVHFLYLQGYRYAEALEKARERAKELEALAQHKKHEERYP